MYIHDRPLTSWRPRQGQPRAIRHMARSCSCGGHRWGLAEPPVQRRPIKDGDVPVASTTTATKAIARRVRNAVAAMSRSYDATLQNTARRVVDRDVTIRFVGDLKPVANPEGVLKSWGMSPVEIANMQLTHDVMDIPGSAPALVPKTGRIRAFERRGVVYIPTDSSEPKLSIDIVHEVNHALNPVHANERTDPPGYLWQAFTAEARAAYVADYREQMGSSNRGYGSLRLEKAIDHARQQAAIRRWTALPAWNAAFEARVRTWTPDGNLDNHK